ncbi:AAA family ATPase [Phenylobacterium immobile]|jgi:predicted kinase|uniref:AAA family ATPase n=1 Tax=Phenylobacterium immobile TaxID=21 RepID=UPI000A5E2844|nr:ATP-binding protein [Phenylobacterium immobile]
MPEHEPATLHVVFGPSGAGKTSYALTVARRDRLVPFILDDWMATLFGPDMPTPIEYEWMIERVGRCEEQIWSSAAGVLTAGTSVIFDIGLMTKADRARVRQIAEAAGVPVQFHFVTAPQEVRRQRVESRNEIRGETFAIEVQPHMFDFIEGVYEAPDTAELDGAIISESQ